MGDAGAGVVTYTRGSEPLKLRAKEGFVRASTPRRPKKAASIAAGLTFLQLHRRPGRAAGSRTYASSLYYASACSGEPSGSICSSFVILAASSHSLIRWLRRAGLSALRLPGPLDPVSGIPGLGGSGMGKGRLARYAALSRTELLMQSSKRF